MKKILVVSAPEKSLISEVAEFLKVDLSMFNNTQTTILAATGTNDLSYEMKTYYSDYLIDNAYPELVHDQFGQKRPIPKNGGKIIEFRKYSPLSKSTTPLTEGVTPSGQALNVTVVTATVAQYGGYVELSDMLLLTAIDNNLVEATKLLGHQAGETLDTITRNVINAGTNVQYNDADVAARYLLVGGESSGNHYFGVNPVRRAVRNMKYNKAKKINGTYVGIIHPDTAYDMMGDDDWLAASEYAGSTQIFEGEIGKIHGVRFVETTEAKVFHAEDLVADGSANEARNLTVASYTNKVITISEALSAAEATALAARYIIVDGYKYTVASAAAGSAGAATITITEAPTHDPAGADVIYPGEAGAKGRDIYSTLIVGADAYGVTEITGGGLETIVKQLGSSGTADPLNQRATVGWKATKVAEILVQTYMVRVESASTFNNNAAN
jgi:N4-gp56 family major capsid protein